jgi:deoxyhypusine synthase
MTVAVNENDLKLVLEKLDGVKLEILRLRAMLLPEEEVTAEERKEIEAAEKEMEKGSKISLKEFLKELGC